MSFTCTLGGAVPASISTPSGLVRTLTVYKVNSGGAGPQMIWRLFSVVSATITVTAPGISGSARRGEGGGGRKHLYQNPKIRIRTKIHFNNYFILQIGQHNCFDLIFVLYEFIYYIYFVSRGGGGGGVGGETARHKGGVQVP